MIVVSYRRDPSLQPMSEQIKVMSASPGAKLSRKKPASKTIKRNKQHETVEKFKDKKVCCISFKFSFSIHVNMCVPTVEPGLL